MQFYKIEGTINDKDFIEANSGRRASREITNKLSCLTEAFNKKHEEAGLFAISSISDAHMQLCAAAMQDNFVEKYLAKFFKAIGLVVKDISTEEVVCKTFESMVRMAYREDYIEDDDTIRDNTGLSEISGHWGRGAGWGENLIKENGLNHEEALEACNTFLGRSDFSEELDRIFAGKEVKFQGHPVHYFIQTNNKDNRREMYHTLLGSLYSKKRIHNRRYTYMDVCGYADIDGSSYEALYKMASGGCVIVRYSPIDEDETMYASSEREIIEFACRMAKKYRNQVLTLFCFPPECIKIKDMFYENLENMCFIELKEDLAYGEEARNYLKYLASARKIRFDSKLGNKVEEGKGYNSTELQNFFEQWYDHKLRSNYYPQYKTAERIEKKIQKTEPKGSAYDRLQQMIGLDSAKSVINEALDYYKALKIFKNRGMKQDHLAMHMCFTGSPGTAKTSVARLFAQIMKENGLLSKGQLIECGRQDLVGKYVGWTAPTVQKKFKEAKGGVLFVDEAYSLVDDRDGSYGDEAIAAIVAEMENHRDDVVVIFAGYSDKMEKFLQKNPGLRSRIAFHVPFDDYDSNELCRIAGLIAKDKGMKISDDADKKLADIFENARTQSDFGNGRFVRNMVEKARMKQAGRLVRMDLEKITDDDLITITAEDIEAPSIGNPEPERHIGFCA